MKAKSKKTIEDSFLKRKNMGAIALRTVPKAIAPLLSYKEKLRVMV